MEANIKMFSSAEYARIKNCARPMIAKFCNEEKEKYNFNVILNSTVEKAQRYLDKFDAEKSSFSTWVGVIARSCALDFLDGEKKWYAHHRGFSDKVDNVGVTDLPMVSRNNQLNICEPEFDDRESVDSKPADYNIISKENLKMILKACKSLGEETGLAIILSAQGYSDREIAKHLGCSDTALRARLMRGRKKLRQHPDILALHESYLTDSKVA